MSASTDISTISDVMRRRRPTRSDFKRSVSSKQAVVGSLLAIAVGLLPVVVVGPRAMADWNIRRSWIEAPCTILKSGFETVRKSQSRRYVPAIEYRYELDGVAHASSTFGPRETRMSGARVSEIVERYPVGTTRRCLINPSDPRQAVLEAWNASHVYIMLLGIPFLAMGAYGLVVAAARSRD